VAKTVGLSATLVLNKVDLVEENVKGIGFLSAENKTRLLDNAQKSIAQFNTLSEDQLIPVSVKTGQGMDILKQHLLSLVGHDAQVEGAYIARRRHLDAISSAKLASLAALDRLKYLGHSV